MEYDDMLFFIGVCLVAAVSVAVYCMIRLLLVKKQLNHMEMIVDEIVAGNGKRRILVPTGELTASFAYKVNEIVYNYEEQLTRYRLADEGNRQLMTSLSHDVRTPLTTLIGYLDAAHKGIITGKEYNTYIEIARRKAYDLKEYIDILFDWFKLNSNEFTLELKEEELSRLLRNILRDWITVFDERAIQYDIDIPEKPLRTMIDSEGVIRVINNLIQNVLNHSQAKEIGITLNEKDDRIYIRIWDNGIGISKNDIPHLFERLYKCDKSRTAKGSGLGLAIVKELVERMSGKITVESAETEYTVFIISFPVADKSTSL